MDDDRNKEWFMKESTKILRQKIHKYIELCNRRSTATDNFNKSYYDMKAQELKEELDGQIYNVNWDLFVRALVKILKENNINHLISSEIIDRLITMIHKSMTWSIFYLNHSTMLNISCFWI